MRKLFAIAFTCVYLTLAVGVVRTTHYCMGRVKSSALFSFESQKCPCAFVAQYWGNTCCNDEHELIRIDDDHAASSVVLLTPEYFDLGPSFVTIERPVPASEPSLAAIDHTPPDVPVPLFIRYCARVTYDEGDNA